MPAIPALWEAKAGISLETRSLRPAWPTWQNPISTTHTHTHTEGNSTHWSLLEGEGWEEGEDQEK